MSDCPAKALAAQLHKDFPTAPQALGIAISGGGDSTALLLLLHEWAATTGTRLHAVTIDHGLRPEAAAEAQMVATLCARLGIPHQTLKWAHRPETGNFQDLARRARQRLIAGWAERHGLKHVALGHTLDDQAETVLLRLARGSGVDGLSAMQPVRQIGAITWIRPLLSVPRTALREMLRAREIPWAEDPSNSDDRFDRVRIRQALRALAPVGIDPAGLAATARRMAHARAALEQATLEAARRMCTLQAGDVLIDRAGLRDLPGEIRDRLLSHALCFVASAEYRPRHDALHRLLASLDHSDSATLHGCHVTNADGTLRVTREWAAVREEVSPAEGLWDRRWRLFLPQDKGLASDNVEIRALGEEGLAQCPEWRTSALPRRSLLASPSAWEGRKLLAAPLAGAARGWRAETHPDDHAFFARILSH